DPTSAPDVDSRLWSNAVSRTLLADRVVAGLRIPDAGGYLEDLGPGRGGALARGAPAKAPAKGAEARTQRTQARGPRRPPWHYQRSLNRRATAPQPPDRGT